MFLKKLFLCFDDKGEHIPQSDFKKTMETLSAGAITSLESFYCCCPFPVEETFHSLVRMNKFLRDVRIYVKGSEKLEYAEIFTRVTGTIDGVSSSTARVSRNSEPFGQDVPFKRSDY